MAGRDGTANSVGQGIGMKVVLVRTERLMKPVPGTDQRAGIGFSLLELATAIILTMAAFAWGGQLPAEIVTRLAVWFMLWYICYRLYKGGSFSRFESIRCLETS